MPPGPRRPLPAGRAVAVQLAAALTALLALATVLAPLLMPTDAAAAVGVRPSAAGRAVPGPVVLIGTGGVRWAETGPATPALRGLLVDGAAAVASARSIRTSTCPVDGWLAVSAGARAADEPGPCAAPAAVVNVPGGSATVPRWPVWSALAARSPAGAVPGLLQRTLAAEGVSSAAVGPGAALALAGPEGRVPAAWPGLPAGAGGAVDPDGDPAALAAQVRAALAAGPRLVVVDVGAVRSPASVPPAAQLRAVDARLAAVLAQLPPTATVLVASLADAGGQARLQLAAARGPAPGGGTYAGLLRSSSTRHDGLVQTTDVAPTLLAALGLPAPAAMVGAALTTPAPDPPSTGEGGAATAERRLQQLDDLARPAEVIDPIVAPFFAAALALELLLLVTGCALTARQRRAGHPRAATTARVTAGVALTGALLPAGTFLANVWPWWRGAAPALALAAAVAVATLALGLVAVAGPWRRSLLGPAGAVGALTALVLTADVATGSRLSLTALVGGQPLVGGRFYGFSNPGFALFATGALLLAVAVADPLVRARRPRAAAVAVAVVGVVATAIDGLPGLGSDFGGPPALVPAFAYLALRVAGVRLTWLRVLVVGLGTGAVLAALAVGDWSRPPAARTHLGRFVQTVLDGGGWAVVTRKAEQNLGIITSSPVQLVLPLLAVVAGVALARPARWRLDAVAAAYEQAPALRPGLGAVAVLLVAGFVVNDSGAAIPPVAAMMLLPVLVACAVRAVTARRAGPPAPPVPASGPATPSGRRPPAAPPAARVPGSGAGPA